VDLLPPKDFANKYFNIQQWTKMPKGGHFAAMEQPELLAEDLRKFATNILVQTQPEESLERALR
jgi:pimeloyl-ACP methyl ester carboxylesterase